MHGRVLGACSPRVAASCSPRSFSVFFRELHRVYLPRDYRKRPRVWHTHARRHTGRRALAMVRRIPPVVATARGKGGGGGGLSAPPPLCTQVTLFSRYPTQHTKKTAWLRLKLHGEQRASARERERVRREGAIARA